jgi:3'-5' exoribonuclease
MKQENVESPRVQPPIRDLRENERIQGAYLVRDKRMGVTRAGKRFMTLGLADRTGVVEARIWDNAAALSKLFDRGDVIEISGTTESYKGNMQMKVSDLQAMEKDVDPSLFLETAPEEASKMSAALKSTLKKLQSTHLRRLVDSFFTDAHFMALFRKAPAAKSFHHNYLGGLLEHTLSVCKMAVQVANHYPQLEGDLLLAAAFLHDLGKIRELKYHAEIDYTDEGRLIGHVVLGVSILEEKLRRFEGFPDDTAVLLKHLVVSHHGEYEFGAPKRPKSLEAFALHLIDDLDAKINGLSRFMERDQHIGAWTDFNRLFERFFFKRKFAETSELEVNKAESSEEQGSLFT